MRHIGFLSILLAFCLICVSYQQLNSSNELNGTWKITDISLNDSEKNENGESILKFIKESNPTTIDFKISNGKGSYRIFSDSKLLEEANDVSFDNGKLCRLGIEDCAIVEMESSKCKLVFNEFTYFLSK